METTSGKIKNRDTGEELVFSVNPTEYHFSRNFDYNVEPCLGQAAPMVSYRSGGASELTSQLIFDQDADSKLDIKKLNTFVKNLNKISTDTKSTPLLEFSMGSFVFAGYARRLSFHGVRFDARGDVTSARLDLALVSNGDYENGKN